MSPNNQPEPVKRQKILIVEDHPAMLSALSSMLSGAFPGCLLLAAASAEKAVPLCLSERPDVVIMDISLIGMNGIVATRQIREQNPDTSVVIHSANDMQIYRDAAAAAGAAAFVSKQDTSKDLIPAIAAALAS
jgi:two-component system response regulator DegU